MATVGNPSASRPELPRPEALRAREAGPTEAPERGGRPDVRIEADPTQLMLDMAEELGFIKAEELAGATEVEGDQDEAFEDLISDLIRESLEAQAGQSADTRQDAEALRARLIQMQIAGSPSQQLDDLLRRYTGGSSQRGLALMAELEQLAKQDPALARLGFTAQAVADYALAHEPGLVAALNIAGALAETPGVATDTAKRILGLYEDSIATSQSVLQTFQSLGRNEGISTIAEWRGFLTEAVAADLAKQNSSGEKAQLQLILAELKGFRTFNTLTQGLERLQKYLPGENRPDPATLMQSTLDYVEQPIREFPRVEAWVSGRTTQQQILFFQGFRNLLKSLPEDAFASAEQKAGLLVPPQKRVDDLTFTEDV